ncbi:MAG: AmmeMemoRadiSam system protein B [Bacteroidales bacterium]
MKPFFRPYGLLVHLLFCLVLCPSPLGAQIRDADFAGSFYPAGKSALEAELDRLYRENSSEVSNQRVQVVLVPHAGYDYSGPVAAAGYARLSPDARYKNIFLIAVSHRPVRRGRGHLRRVPHAPGGGLAEPGSGKGTHREEQPLLVDLPGAV